MAIKVVDASALAALLFGEPDAEAISDKLTGHQLVAPGLLRFELANICLMKCRKYPGQRDALLQAFRLQDQLEIEQVNVDHIDTIEIAMKTKFTAYDASYLWLAQKLDAELITLDKELGRAANTYQIK